MAERTRAAQWAEDELNVASVALPLMPPWGRRRQPSTRPQGEHTGDKNA